MMNVQTDVVNQGGEQNGAQSQFYPMEPTEMPSGDTQHVYDTEPSIWGQYQLSRGTGNYQNFQPDDDAVSGVSCGRGGLG